MKKRSTLYIKIQILSLIFLSLLFLSPLDLFAQKGKESNDIYIVLSCTEYVGDGKIRAHFGYENKGKKTVVISEDGSVVTYNHGQSKKLGLYSFEPGVKEKAFSQDFDSKDRVEWSVEFADGTIKTTDANINSNHCRGIEESLNIIPGYLPPEGGKEYNSKIGAELTSLYNVYSNDPVNFEGATDDIFQLAGSKVLIEVVANASEFGTMISSLGLVGFDLVTEDPDIHRATGWEEIGDLLLLNEMAALYYARPVYPGVSNFIVPATGLTKSQGDFAMHSDFARLGFDIDGAGVKIGVLSNSYNTKGKAHIDVGNGDLPGPGNPNGDSLEVDVLKDILPTHGTLSDEGRAMLQIIHDIAPGAELAFRTGFLGEQDMALGIRELANAGSNVIVDDLSYITEPFFRDGVISQTIDSVVNEGVSFFSSAGNFGRASYMGVYDSTAAPTTITGTAHDFDGLGDIFQNVLLPEGSYTMVLQWDDGSDPSMNTTTTDLDIFLSDDVGFSLMGFNRENVGGFPIEVVPFSVIGDSVVANIVIARASGPTNVDVLFKYMMFRGGSQFQMLEHGVEGSSTIVGHPNAAKAISVGAVRFDKNPIYNAAEYPVPVIMSFSSVGGTPVNGVVRDKPDITAPNGINTTVDLGNGDWISPIDPDTLYPNFFGTSAASPHAAGAAALILEAKSIYDSLSLVTPDTIKAMLKGTALDMEDHGFDHVSGAGFLQAHKALMTFANPSPYVENLILASEGGVPGTEITPFSFTVTGDFFTDSTQILFRGEPLEEGVVVVDESTITVDHEGFIGNPEVLVYTPPISSSELDGGYSEEIYFSDPVKQRVVISANNVAKKFGEVVPDFSASFLVITVDDDSLTLEEAVSDSIMLQAEADRLSGLTYAVPAGDTSDAGQYIIIPSLFPEVDTVAPAEIDLAISEKYILEFVHGSLSIEKLALTITPMDTSLVYGQMLPAQGFQFLYQIGDSSLVITNPDSILISVQQEHTAALTNEIALVRGVALVNGIPVIRGTALVNGVTMLRGVALVNGIEVKVEIEGADTTVYVAGEPLVNGGSLIRGVALVNDRPFVSMTEIVRGVALVNGDEVTFDDGYMTQLNGVPLVNAVPVVRGVALVNGIGQRGVALVNGHTILVENGVTTIDGAAVSVNGVALVNGIPVIRGTALVNSSLISRGVALVNGLDVVIENGLPTGRGVALVNGVPTLRGIALVNGLPLIRGTALVNNLEVHVDDGEVSSVFENGTPLVNGLTMSRGIALVNGTALVNGSQLISRGTALVNGIALTDEDGDGEELVNLANMNFMASSAALANGLNSLRGVPLVNGLESEDGEELKIAAGTVQEDGSIVYENGSTSRGVALVNGLNYVRGTALVNGSPLNLRGTALVNGSTINDSTNNGTILVFDATELGDTTENVGFTPISFITGTTVGQHWIVPGTYISNNYEISYGLGTLTIDPADLTITAQDQIKTYGEEDPALTYSDSGLLGEDTLAGALIREVGEDVGDYAILQGSLSAGDNYAIQYDSANLSITQRVLEIEINAEDKIYDGTTMATTTAFIEYGMVEGDTISVSSANGAFDTNDVGIDKLVEADVSLTGVDAFNYLANVSADTTATILLRALEIEITAEDKVYDGTPAAATAAFVEYGMVEGDTISVSSSNGMFDNKNVGGDKAVTADVAVTGVDAHNYLANASADTTATILLRALEIEINADDKTYDGTPVAVTSAFVEYGMVEGDDISVFSSNGIFSDKNVGDDKVVTADVSVTGVDATNYLANLSADTTATISLRELEIEITAEDKTYDGGTSATSAAFVEYGMVEGDDILVSSSNGLFDTKNVGEDKAVTADISVTGLDATNYLANVSADTTATITTKELVIGMVASDKTYNGTATAATSASILSGLVDEDDVTVSSSNGLFNNKNVGTDKPVTADVSTLGEDAGNYAANTTAAATADIHAKDLLIDISAVSKEYDGNATAVSSVSLVTGLVSGDDVTASTSNGLFNNKNVGTAKPVTAAILTAGDDAGNYAANTTALTTADITARDLLIDISAVSKDYDGTATAATSVSLVTGLLSGDDVTVNSSNGLFNNKSVGTTKPVTAAILTSGVDAGNYAASTTAASTADISPINLVIGINAVNKVYDGTYLASTTAFVSGGLISGDAVTVSSANGLFFDKNVGTWSVSADVYKSGADAGNYLANVSAESTADITQREVSVTPSESFLYINERDPLPVFAFIYSGWISADAGNEGYTVLRDTDGAVYDPSSNVSAGTYIVTPVPSNNNYSFTLETGILHVNPYGPGTRAVKPVLNCIEEIDTNYFIANFEYKNENDVAVYIPEGVDNMLTGSGIDWENFEGLPTMFEPGGGTFVVYFDGSELSWTVNSRDQNQKVSNAANANSSSTKCHTNVKSASVTGSATVEELEPDYLNVYPNPVVDKVHITMKDIENYKMIQLYDLTGRSHPITSIDKRTDNLEIDMAQLSAGNYFIRIVMEDSSRVVQIIKE